MRLEPASKLLLGLGSGAAFGLLLQKGRVGKPEVILDQLLLRDGTVAKVMGTAVAVGAVGAHALAVSGRAPSIIKPLKLGGVLGGAAVFGAGLALLGYCPGTTLAALGEGRRDALAGVAGMLSGAGLYVRLYPALKPIIDAGDLGKVTLPAATRTRPSRWVAAIVVAVCLALGLAEVSRQ
jgi:uncharacterized membrane protein YedE/YeeE